MRTLEYVFSLLMAMAVLGGMAVWSQAAQAHDAKRIAAACRRAHSFAAPVTLKGLVVYPGCPSAAPRS